MTFVQRWLIMAALAAATVAETVTGNYTACHENAERLTKLQQFVAEQHALIEKLKEEF